MHHKPINPERNQRDGGGVRKRWGIPGQREFNKRGTLRREGRDANMDDG